MTGQGGPACRQHLPCTPSPEIVPWVDSVSFLSYKESCVHHWQRKGRNSAQLRPPASRFPSGSYQWSPPSCSKQPPRIVSLPHLPSTTRVPCCSHARRHPVGTDTHPLQPYQITEGTPQRPHFSCRDRKKLIDPLMHSQVKKKNSKETHVAAWVPVVQLWRGGSVLA